MPKNLEVKAAIQRLDEALMIAKSIGARFCAELSQQDTYFNVPRGRLKLRETDENCGELIFYERDEESNERLSQFDTLPIHDSSGLKSFLERALGVRSVVRKSRLLFMYEDTRIHLDDVERLGTFIEFEAPITRSQQIARERLNYLIKEFQINPSQCIRQSYVDLLLMRKSSDNKHEGFDA